MSREISTWLNTNTLIGFTDKRGSAWHWRAEEQGEQSNHYPGAIPLEDVQTRLFGWTAESRRLAVEVPASVTTATHSRLGLPMKWEVVPERQAICRSDTDDGTVMGIFGPGYTRHQYDEWLLSTVADLLDDELSTSSAGLLRAGAIAWVEVSMPHTITTPEGVAFRPNLLATTSFDGSIATTYKRTVTDTVCDNTRELALSEAGQEFKVKHSRNSRAQLGPARLALQLVHNLADDFAAEVASLCATTVSDSEWRHFLDRLVPRVDPKTSRLLEGRALGMADRKRETIDGLYRRDPRVAPWSASGGQHLRPPRGDHPRRSSREEWPEGHHWGLRTARSRNLADPAPTPTCRLNPDAPADSGRRGHRGPFVALGRWLIGPFGQATALGGLAGVGSVCPHPGGSEEHGDDHAVELVQDDAQGATLVGPPIASVRAVRWVALLWCSKA
jgi:phage/plasmid-like protein (TIGR03299 family)